MILRIFFVFSLLMVMSCSTVHNQNTASNISVKELVKDPETTLVDVRIPAEFETKTAAGAINIPLAEIENNLDFLKSQKQVVVFCNRGRQAEEALQILKKNGIHAVSAKTLDNVNAIKIEN